MNAANPDLRKKALRGVATFVVALAGLIFLPAWSLTFWQGWVYWLVFSSACLLITLYFLKRDPGLIESRLNAGAGAEKEKRQKTIQGFLSVVFIGLFILPGLDHSLGRSAVPPVLVLIADALVALGFAIIFWTFRVNGHASSIIEVKENQPVVATGPYAAVRHPMYAGAALLLFATPVALGSWWGLVLVIPALAGIAWRLIDEETFLVKNLPGYADYVRQTRFRLVPLVGSDIPRPRPGKTRLASGRTSTISSGNPRI